MSDWTRGKNQRGIDSEGRPVPYLCEDCGGRDACYGYEQTWLCADCYMERAAKESK